MLVVDLFAADGPEVMSTVVAAADGGHTELVHAARPDLGDPLPDMPLFLTQHRYVSVPLEATYQAAWAGVARHLRRILERRSDADQPQE